MTKWWRALFGCNGADVVRSVVDQGPLDRPSGRSAEAHLREQPDQRPQLRITIPPHDTAETDTDAGTGLGAGVAVGARVGAGRLTDHANEFFDSTREPSAHGNTPAHTSPDSPNLIMPYPSYNTHRAYQQDGMRIDGDTLVINQRALGDNRVALFVEQNDRVWGFIQNTQNQEVVVQPSTMPNHINCIRLEREVSANEALPVAVRPFGSAHTAGGVADTSRDFGIAAAPIARESSSVVGSKGLYKILSIALIAAIGGAAYYLIHTYSDVIDNLFGKNTDDASDAL
jgi:hypothetical protein